MTGVDLDPARLATALDRDRYLVLALAPAPSPDPSLVPSLGLSPDPSQDPGQGAAPVVPLVDQHPAL